MPEDFDDHHGHRHHHRRHHGRPGSGRPGSGRPGSGRRGRGGPFGGRRPLRFLARRLDLSEDQFRRVAAILGDLRTAREQAALDARRAMATYAAGLELDAFTADAVADAGAQRAASARAMHDAMVTALKTLHEILDEEQRADLAMLLREAPPWLL